MNSQSSNHKLIKSQRKYKEMKRSLIFQLMMLREENKRKQIVKSNNKIKNK